MMKRLAMAGIGFALAATGACGQAALPAFWSGPWKTGLPSGWTQTGMGNDYASNYDGEGGTAGKFDSSGDFLQVNFSGTAAEVSYYIQGNSLSGEYTFKVQESSNGSTWTDVVTYNSGNPIQNSTPMQVTNSLLASTRNVKFLYVTKATGNVGLDGVLIEGPGAPSVTFDPSGAQEIAVSNELALAVSITPAGSGMQGWSLLPAYAGSASLTGGAFSFTPASGDNGKTFTLSVVGTNAIGSTTGTVSITVTPYEPPVPVISFSPEAPYSLMATETQKLGIAVSPAGSGISSWTLLPSNYTGTASLTGTNFTFTTAESDGPETYTFTVLATNSFGTTTGEVSISVSAFVPPPPPGAYIASFEDASKTGYAADNVTLSNVVWELDGILIGTSADDLKIDGKAARLKYDPTDGSEAMTSQSTLLANGIGTIALWYGPYGTHGEDAPVLGIEISDDLLLGWIEVGEVDAGSVSELTYASFDVYVNEPIYVRIRAKDGTPNRSANFDNVTITPYVSPANDPYDAYLLEYNVTPGDPGTEPGDDWDGDGFTNQQEYQADPQTNPYDPDSHP